MTTRTTLIRCACDCYPSGTLLELRDVDFGGPLHSFVLVGKMHDIEEEMFQHYRLNDDTPRLPPITDSDDASLSSDSDDEGAGGGAL